jgi:hypothetical protein
MRVPPVPVELLLAGHEIANRPGRQCVINTLLAEQRPYGFDLIYAAPQRICALTEALQSFDLDECLVFGTPYHAVTTRFGQLRQGWRCIRRAMAPGLMKTTACSI